MPNCLAISAFGNFSLTCNNRQINVGVDVWGFRPVSEQMLLHVMQPGRVI